MTSPPQFAEGSDCIIFIFSALDIHYIQIIVSPSYFQFAGFAYAKWVTNKKSTALRVVLFLLVTHPGIEPEFPA